MKILLFQHATSEHPGIFRDFLKEDGHRLETVELDKGDPIPSLTPYDALWVMGGPMDVWQEGAYPWLAEEKDIIASAVLEKDLPFLGICLGHQLLAAAIGGTVGPLKTPEVGVMEARLTEAGKKSPFFKGLNESISCLQWHGAEVQSVPETAVVLATAPACAINGMSVGERALSLQFHVEVEEDTVRQWAAIPEYAQALHDELGERGTETLERDCARQMPAFNSFAKSLYRNWCEVI